MKKDYEDLIFQAVQATKSENSGLIAALKSNTKEDHDLLIRVDQKVGDLQISVKEISDGTISKITALEKNKADRDEVDRLQKIIDDNIEIRIKKLEGWKNWVMGIGLICGIVLGTMSGLVINHLLAK
jgi:hypothetical protein